MGGTAGCARVGGVKRRCGTWARKGSVGCSASGSTRESSRERESVVETARNTTARARRSPPCTGCVHPVRDAARDREAEPRLRPAPRGGAEEKGGRKRGAQRLSLSRRTRKPWFGSPRPLRLAIAALRPLRSPLLMAVIATSRAFSSAFAEAVFFFAM